ncbi:MAG: MFS transporter [Betaproteobacteria bacterium]|nr:MFS transporter [Betaproteobacteria bacterium]
MPATPAPTLPPPTLAWAIWSLGAALYFIGFYQRVAPAVIAGELSTAFGLTAAGLGHLSAFYFYSYVAMQMPTGILADRLGPRKLLTAGTVVAALGTAVFALAPTATVANLGRMLIGASVGVAFVSMLKLASVWMPPRQFALASGLALAVGVLGAVFAGAPLGAAAQAIGWRAAMGASAAATLLLAFAVWFTVRDHPAERGYDSHAARSEANAAARPHVWADLREIARARNVVLLFFAAGAASAMVLTFAGLWGVPFLMTHYGLTRTAAAAQCSTMMVAWALGSIAYSAASDRMGRRKAPFIGGLIIALALWCALIYGPRWPIGTLTALMVGIGFFGGCFILTFAFSKESGPARLSGTVSGIANMGVIQGPMLMQPLVGVMLDASWTGALQDGVRVFEWAAYQRAFSLVLAWGALSLLLLAFTRETGCRQQS